MPLLMVLRFLGLIVLAVLGVPLTQHFTRKLWPKEFRVPRFLERAWPMKPRSPWRRLLRFPDHPWGK